MTWRHMLPKGEISGSLYPVATREWGEQLLCKTPEPPSKVPSVLATQAQRGRRGIRKTNQTPFGQISGARGGPNHSWTPLETSGWRAHSMSAFLIHGRFCIVPCLLGSVSRYFM